VLFKFAGFMLILNALVFLGYWVLNDHRYKGWALTLCGAAVFAGALLIVQGRISGFAIPKIGEIKTAVEQAQVDAEAIASIKMRVENQSATVDAVAAQAKESAEAAKAAARDATEAIDSCLSNVLYFGREDLHAPDRKSESARAATRACHLVARGRLDPCGGGT
jgi:hypothetical protein